MIRQSTIDKYVGKRYGRLTVKSFCRIDPNNRHHYLFNCVCDCGKESPKRISCLQQGSTKSCGCLGRENSILAHTGNTYKRLSFGEGCRNIVFSRYKKEAINRGLSFELDIKEFSSITKKHCFYCGAPPNSELKASHGYGSYIYNGIDRVDNEIGYKLNNCVPCCKKCNSIKNGITKEMIHKLYHRLFKK